MKNFEVYKLWPVEPVKASGCHIQDREGNDYLDMYGGHAVISIGHCHPDYNEAIEEQLSKIAFYSNSVRNSLQEELAELLGKLCGYEDYSLFLCNSGAEANENALKVASFKTGRKKVIAFDGAFHGRTSGAVAVTDNMKIISPYNSGHKVSFVPLNDIDAVEKELAGEDCAAVIVEGIQGVAGIYVPDKEFLNKLGKLTKKYGTLLILDEVQSGYGRSGKFFAHQHSSVRPDMITIAKGMGNGFPVGGVLISGEIEAEYGMLGTTFGGNHLACAAALAVLRVIEKEDLVARAEEIGKYLNRELTRIQNGTGKGKIGEVRGLGLMIGVDMKPEYYGIRERLLSEKKIFTGVAKKGIIRLLPPLTITRNDLDIFLGAFEELLMK